MCLSAWEGAKSGSCSSHTFFYFPMPHWETRSTATLTCFVIPLLTTEFAVDVDKNEKKQNTWCEHATRTWFARTQNEELSLRAPACSLIPFDRPSFDLDKKAWWCPLEVFCGYDVISEYIFFSSWTAPEELLVQEAGSDGLQCWPKVLHATFPWRSIVTILCDYFVGSFFSGQSKSLKCICLN